MGAKAPSWVLCVFGNPVVFVLIFFFFKWSLALVAQAGVQRHDLGPPQPLPPHNLCLPGSSDSPASAS